MRRHRLLLYGGLLIVLVGALYWRVRSRSGPPSELASLSLTELEARAAREPRNHWLQLELGVRYVKRGRQVAAKAAFERCIALAPHTMEAYAYLGTMYTQRHAYRQAVRMFERAVACNDTFAPGYLELGNLYYKLHNFRRARRAADRYVALKPDDWQGHYLRGLVYFMEGELDAAQQNYERAVHLAPERSASYLAVGLTLLFRPATPDRLAQAVQWFERGLKVDPAYANLHYYLGVARFRQKEWEKAAEALQRAVQLDPQLTEAYYPLGQALRKLNKVEEAKRYLATFERLRGAEKLDPAQQMERGMVGAERAP